ncbi:MAG: sugar ABC transporter ATP-binding protein, partial [Pyrinomonadaceae bacterium]|nr:sugar ABC transporter ATP-binding protein [Phycisphaerales bacterium]
YIDVRWPLGSFSIAPRQLVAIARAIDMQARVLILDEPTSSLDEAECGRLFHTMDSLKKSGVGMIFVTHFLDQVYRVSDRIVVLRNGRVVGDAAAAEMPRMKLVELMLGRAMEAMPAAASTHDQQWSGRPARDQTTSQEPGATPGPLVESQRLLDVKDLGRLPSHPPFALAVHRGEVVGLAGLLGSGRTESARLVFGADRATSGTLSVHGKKTRTGSPRASIRCGMGYCSEDRKAEGIFPGLSVRENLTMVVQRTLSKAGILNRKKQREIAARFIQKLGVAASDMEQPIETLSGGNQQKVLLARWLAAKTQLLILDEPTRGIDVGARAEIERLIRDFVAGEGAGAGPNGRDLRSTGAGGGVLLISSELDELARVCSRAYVLRHRRVVASLGEGGGGVTESSMMKAIAEHTADV